MVVRKPGPKNRTWMEVRGEEGRSTIMLDPFLTITNHPWAPKTHSTLGGLQHAHSWRQELCYGGAAWCGQGGAVVAILRRKQGCPEMLMAAGPLLTGAGPRDTLPPGRGLAWGAGNPSPRFQTESQCRLVSQGCSLPPMAAISKPPPQAATKAKCLQTF